MEPLVENQETERVAMLCKTLNAAKIDNDVSCQLFSVGPKKTFAVVSMKLSNEWTMNSDRKWSCSVSSVGLWSSVDTGGGYRSYRSGQNDDDCTCVTPQDVPISFSP